MAQLQGRLCTTSLPIALVDPSHSLISILLQRHIFPRCPELQSLSYTSLRKQDIIGATAVSSWPICLSNHSPIHGPGLHPPKSITIRWQWNRRKPSDSKPYVYLLVPADRRGDLIPGQRIDIVERLPLQYHRILWTEGTITVSQCHPIVANAQVGRILRFREQRSTRRRNFIISLHGMSVITLRSTMNFLRRICASEVDYTLQ